MSERTCFKVAVQKVEWVQAMKEEMQAIEKNKTQKLVDLPLRKNANGLKQIYKSKFNVDGTLQKHKAQLVAKDLLKRFHLSTCKLVSTSMNSNDKLVLDDGVKKKIKNNTEV